MQTVCITGGIGSGKTTVSRIVECLGFPVYYADEQAKRITAQSPEALAAIQALFGSHLVVNGVLDRKGLAQVVFGNPEALKKLNGVIHPLVRADYDQWLSSQSAALVFSEIAIAIESGRYRDFDRIVLVKAPLEDRMRRVMARDGLNEPEVRARIANQLSDEEKSVYAHSIIHNADTDGLIPQVISVVQSLLGN